MSRSMSKIEMNKHALAGVGNHLSMLGAGHDEGQSEGFTEEATRALIDIIRPYIIVDEKKNWEYIQVCDLYRFSPLSRGVRGVRVVWRLTGGAREPGVSLHPGQDPAAVVQRV
jgi:hypothetical protein